MTSSPHRTYRPSQLQVVQAAIVKAMQQMQGA